MSRAVRWIAAALVVGLVGIQWRARAERQELERFRDRVLEARGAADACARDLAVAEAEFRELDRRVDSLRAAVDTLEALDPRGVPAPRYEEYLTVVDAYNADVERWERRADELQADEAACRAVVDHYNTLADSARGSRGAPGGPQSPET